MSKPLNPLNLLLSHEARHILIAFDNAETASQFVLPNEPLGKSGTAISKKLLKCGNGIVVINELEDPTYGIDNLTWSFDFFSPISPNTTVSAGSFVVVDSSGNQFPSFLRRVSRRLGIAESRITFYLITVFRGRDIDNGVPKNHPTSPLIISLVDTATGFREGLVNQFVFNFAFLYNTVAQLPNYSRLTQFTVTNQKNNPSRSVLTGNSVKPGIASRASEDATNEPNRSARINKSAPMRNLKEVFEGFEAELQDTRFTHNRQLQEFISMIRPSAVKKIKPPKHKMTATTELPVKFTVNLDPVYHNYQVDNRNLMTEQTEIRQSSVGISSITLPPGSSIFTAVDTLMKLSSKIGDDVADGYAFKTVMSSVTDCEGVVNHTINVFQYRIPKNKMGGRDTGPDEKGTVTTLELESMDSKSGSDVISLTYASSPSVEVVILEEDSDDLKDDAVTASSQREQITFERYDKTGAMGLRVGASAASLGLERASAATLADTLKHRYALSQNTLTTVDIIGNPDLYSDLARNPLQVSNIHEGVPHLYRRPEYYPMYIRLKVRIGNTMAHGTRNSGDDEDYWYHTYHYHLSGVTNRIVSGRFIQTLRLLSTDDAI